jgi:hypothetical protein
VKLENLPDLYFVLAVFVPGFIYNGVLRQFVPLYESTQKETILIKLLTATAVNYALCLPLIYIGYHSDFVGFNGRLAIWVFVVLVAPTMMALVRAHFVQQDDLGWLFRVLRLRPISPIPTGWDWIFGRTGPCFVLITLTDGTEIAGYFGPNSMASSDPGRKDIYIEKVYRVPDDGTAWTEVSGSLGMHIDGSQISYVEFRGQGDV